MCVGDRPLALGFPVNTWRLTSLVGEPLKSIGEAGKLDVKHQIQIRMETSRRSSLTAHQWNCSGAKKSNQIKTPFLGP